MNKLLIFLLLISCEDRGVNKLKDANKEMYRGEKIENIPKFGIIKTIYDVSESAIDQKWSRQTWVIRFGEPSSNQLLSDDSEIIRYHDPGPYQPAPAKLFLSGAEIILVGDKTTEIRYTHTEL